MTAVPLPFAVTLPLLFTTATFLLLLVHFTLLLAPSGLIRFIFKVWDFPFISVSFVLFRAMERAAVPFLKTVTLHTAFAFLLLLLVAVIFAVPGFFAVTRPFLSTDATFGSEDLQSTLFDAVAGVTALTFKVILFPGSRDSFAALSFSFCGFAAAAWLFNDNGIRNTRRARSSIPVFFQIFFTLSFLLTVNLSG